MSAQDPPPEAAARKRTPSFICEFPLRVTPAQERVLLARLEAARQVYNACLGEARRRVGLVRQSKAFQRARALPKDDPARRTLFAQARVANACSEYGLHAYADQLRQSWLGEHLDSNTCQKLATRAYQTANRLLLGKARRVGFKGCHQLDTVEGKTNTRGLRWRGSRVEWSDLVLPALIKKHDPVLVHGLACPVKYVRRVAEETGPMQPLLRAIGVRGHPLSQATAQARHRHRGTGSGPYLHRHGG